MNRFATYEEENIHYWTHRAPGYSGVNQEELATDQKRVWGRTIQERIAARFPGRKPGSIRVLDVGTGPGFFAIILAKAGYQVTAVDYTEEMLCKAKEMQAVMRTGSVGCAWTPRSWNCRTISSTWRYPEI